MPEDIIGVRLNPNDKKRIENYLATTHKETIAEFFRRLAVEKVTGWETMQREERRRAKEHAAKLAYYGAPV